MLMGVYTRGGVYLRDFFLIPGFSLSRLEDVDTDGSIYLYLGVYSDGRREELRLVEFLTLVVTVSMRTETL